MNRSVDPVTEDITLEQNQEADVKEKESDRKKSKEGFKQKSEKSHKVRDVDS